MRAEWNTCRQPTLHPFLRLFRRLKSSEALESHYVAKFEQAAPVLWLPQRSLTLFPWTTDFVRQACKRLGSECTCAVNRQLVASGSCCSPEAPSALAFLISSLPGMPAPTILPAANTDEVVIVEGCESNSPSAAEIVQRCRLLLQSSAGRSPIQPRRRPHCETPLHPKTSLPYNNVPHASLALQSPRSISRWSGDARSTFFSHHRPGYPSLHQKASQAAPGPKHQPTTPFYTE